MNDSKLFFIFTLLSISIKFLLIPSKFSTDFEVHRNWLAITSNLPLHMWYTEKSSIWTLDYPPFFAYFEMTLGVLAKYLFPNSTFWKQSSHSNKDFDCVLFQKLSVIASDLFIYAAIFLRLGKYTPPSKNFKIAFLILSLLPSLLIVDHIHFQYNGFLIGLFLFCVNAFYECKLLIGSVLFVILVCFKHIFIVFAPVLGLFVLFSIFAREGKGIYELLLISYSCIKVILIAFLPFIFKGQIYKIAERLFPVHRGLMHSYWAPNFWALYSSLDLTLKRFFLYKPEFHYKIFGSYDIPSSTLCNGLTGEKKFSILPNINPAATLLLIGLFHLPIIYILFKNRSPEKLIKCTFLSGLISFLFGYHVHEKAAIPFVALSLFYYDIFDEYSKKYINNIIISSTIALLPLMQSHIETFIALALVLILRQVLRGSKTNLISFFQDGALLLYILLEYFRKKNDFLSLFVISVSSAAIIITSFLKLYVREVKSSLTNKH